MREKNIREEEREKREEREKSGERERERERERDLVYTAILRHECALSVSHVVHPLPIVLTAC